jgi:hypothetical protein
MDFMFHPDRRKAGRMRFAGANGTCGAGNLYSINISVYSLGLFAVCLLMGKADLLTVGDNRCAGYEYIDKGCILGKGYG